MACNALVGQGAEVPCSSRRLIGLEAFRQIVRVIHQVHQVLRLNRFRQAAGEVNGTFVFFSNI